jgi:peptide/nickel transport system ATP-binding protein
MSEPLMVVADLKTHFFTRDGVVRAVDGVSYEVRAGETLAVVGESGCGKSVTALSILRLVPQPPGRIVGGAIRFAGRDLLGLSEAEMRAIRGNEISMIFQEPMTSLNPVLSVTRQIGESLILHQGLDRAAAAARVLEMLRLVRISEPERRARQYPHELSGGMRQRVMIAMALACNPKLLIADEPTTALDVTIQAQILDLMRELFRRPRHPAPVGLLASVPRLGATLGRADAPRLAEIPGMVPSLSEPIIGCAFAPRCAHVTDRCRREAPRLEAKAPGHFAACFESARLAS